MKNKLLPQPPDRSPRVSPKLRRGSNRRCGSHGCRARDCRQSTPASDDTIRRRLRSAAATEALGGRRAMHPRRSKMSNWSPWATRFKIDWTQSLQPPATAVSDQKRRVAESIDVPANRRFIGLDAYQHVLANCDFGNLGNPARSAQSICKRQLRPASTFSRKSRSRWTGLASPAVLAA